MNQKGFVNIALIVLAVVLVGVGGYFLTNRFLTPSPPQQSPQTTNQLTPPVAHPISNKIPGDKFLPKGKIAVLGRGGAGQLIAECADKNYITNSAHYIIEGKVENTESRWVDDPALGRHIFTFTTIAVKKYVKGDPIGDTIELKTVGGRVGDAWEFVTDVGSPEKGKNVVLYLRKVGSEFELVCGHFGIVYSSEYLKFKSILGEKKYIQHSGEFNEKIDILFIPQNISDISLIEPFIKKILFNEKGAPAPEGVGLFNTDPFIKYKDKFNVFYVDKNLDLNYFNCILEQQEPNKPLKWQLFQRCDNSKIEEEYKIFNPNYIIVIFDLPPGYSSSGGDIQFLDIDTPNFAWTFVHEFAHQFGGLADEYISANSPCREWERWKEGDISLGGPGYNCFESYAKAINIYPNLGTLGCPKWCKSYNINKLLEENKICDSAQNEQECFGANPAHGEGVCTWFKTKHPFLNSNCVRTLGYENIGINCIENSQCIFGGDYGQLAFNPGGSIMGGGLEFNKPSKDHLATILQCCYPRNNSNSCNTFRNKFISLPIDVNYFLKIAYKKIVDCE